MKAHERLGVQPAQAQARGPLQLLDSIDARCGKGPPGAEAMPAGFLEAFAARFEGDELNGIVEPVGAPLPSRVA